MPVVPSKHVLLRRLAAVLVLAVVLAGCSGGDDAGGGDASTASAQVGGRGGNAGAVRAPALLDLRVAAGDAVIRTADLSVRVEDVQAAADQAARLARAVRGRVEAEDPLRINGRACVTTDPDLLASLPPVGKPPRAALVLAVEGVFTHCPKAFVRSGLSDPASWPATSEQPSPAAMPVWVRAV